MSKTDINTSQNSRGRLESKIWVPDFGNKSGFYKTSSSTPVHMLVSETRAGFSTPKFNTRVGPVPPPVQEFNYTKLERTYWNGSERTLKNDVPSWNFTYKDEIYIGLTPIGNKYPYNPITGSEITSVRNIAIQKLLTDLKDQKINYGQAFAERQQTIDLIGSTATRIYRSFRDLKRGDISSAAQHLGVQVGRRRRQAFNRGFARNQAQSVSRGWLELQYGWKPLLQDVYGAAEDLAVSYVPQFQKVQTRKTLRRELNETIDELGGSQYYTGSYKTFLNGSARCTVRVGCTFTVGDSTLRRASQMGLTNPATLAWELTPFSFVADWFLPVGNWINSWDSTLGLNFLDGYITTFQFFSGTGTVAGSYAYKADNTQYTKLYTSSYKIITVKREKLRSFPSARFPEFKNPVSVTHAANALALLFSIFKR